MKKIPEQKLQAFSIGAMGMRSLSKKELEEQRKKEEDEATAHVFQEFVELFQEAPSKTSKVWVKAGTYDAGARKEDNSERGKLYKPQSRLSDANEKKASAEQVEEFTRSFASKPDKPTKKRGDKDKKKSNLELFKEELRQIQEEREERHKYKGVLKTVLADTGDIPAYAKDEPTMGSYDNGDPTTTNLYLGNLNPKVTEQQLMEIFGRYGPLASIKIMWPRSDEEKARGRNCGFVAFMARKDAERALRCINGKDIMGYEMKMGWGKALLIPACPIYIPPALQQPSQPPPQSGLPFNAQPPKHLANKIPRVRPGESYPSDPEDQKLYEQILSQSIVRVVIPTERNVLMMIHRMVEFVIREGPMFEAMIMNKEINNPFFRFLFENQSPAHVYYRWKLFSLLQGDSPKTWSLKDFRMFKGSVWRPPILNMYTQGMPEDLVEEDEIVKDNRGTLSKTQRERLEELIRLLTPERSRVAEAMVFCMEHAEAAEEIADCLAESLSMLATAIHKKVARIYLISDILHNCGIKLTNASYFRKALERRLVQIMVDARAAWLSLEARLQREGFRARVLRVLGAWDHWVVYPKDFLRLLNDTFMGVENKPLEDNPEAVESGGEVGGTEEDEAVSDAGSEEGGPLDGAALRRLAAAVPAGSPARAVPVTSAIAAAAVPVVDDIDGVPLDEDIDGVPLDTSGTDLGSFTAPWDGAGSAPGFVPSRWESVEPAQLQAQAVTTSQWELLAPERRESDPPSPPSPPTPAHSGHDSSQDWESRRALLRAVEVRALRYQDELESGRRALRAGLTMQQQVQHYRRKLIKKAEREVKEKEEVEDSPESRVSDSKRVHRERGTRSISSEEGYTTSTSRKSKKSKEISLSPPPPPKRSRHRSRSAERERDRGRDRRRARSPSPAPSPPRHHTSSSRRHKHKHKY